MKDSTNGISEHDYVCEACLHRLHAECEQECSYCDQKCQCVCRRWAVPVQVS